MFTDDEQVQPPELELALNCKTWGVLPDAGGYLDQDARTMRRMNAAYNIYTAVSRWYNFTGEKIHLIPEHDREVLRALLDNGINFNG